MVLLGLILCFCSGQLGLLCLVIPDTIASGTYGVVITRVTSRTEIPDSCNLVAPSLSIYGSFVNHSLDTAFDSQKPTPSGVWVNYTNDYVYLQILGCIAMKDASVTNTSFQDPLNCSFECKATEYIGFTEREANRTTCLCLTFDITLINTTRSMCNIACVNEELLCGTHGFAAVYSQVTERNLIAQLTTAQENSPEKESCLSNHGGKLEWINCAIPIPLTACMSNCTNEKTFAPIQNRRLPWTEAVAHCLSYNQCPVRLSNYLIRNFNIDVDWWVGVIRVRTKTRQYGYLNTDGDTFYLEFTSNASQFQWALCYGSTLDAHQSTHVFPDPTPGHSKENTNSNYSGTNGVVIKRVTSRTEIPDSCNLVAPSLSIYGSFVNHSLDTAFDSQKPTPSGVWVNYTNDYVYLQIMGCIAMKDASVINTSFQDPLNCSFVCKLNEYIGFTGETNRTECLCLTFNRPSINTTQAMCNIACTNDELLCGTPGFAAVYRQVTERSLIAHLATAQEVASEKEHCLSNHGGTLEWSNCAIPNSFPACMSNCTNGKTFTIPYVRLHWSAAVAHCLNYNRCPVRLSDYLIRNLNLDLDWWVGVIRVQTKTHQYGYLNKEGDTFFLDFTSNASQFQWALCNGSILDTHQKSTQHIAELSTSTANNSGIRVFPDPTPSNSKENTDSNYSVGMYVGLSVAVVVLIVAVIGGFCFWRGRISTPMKDSGDETQFPSGSTAMTNRSCTVNHDDSVYYNCIEDPEPYSREVGNEFEDNYHTIPQSTSISQASSLRDNYDRIHPITDSKISNSYDTGMYINAPNGKNLGNPNPITEQCDGYEKLCLREGPNATNHYEKLGMNRT